MMTAGTGGFSGSAAAKGPVAGFDPVMKMRGKLKKIKAQKSSCCEETDRVNPQGPSRLFQYKINVPEVGETIVFANSPAELRMKLRLAIMPKYRSGINIERIMPGGAAKFFMDKRMKHMKNVKEESELKKANINYKTTKSGGKTTHHVNKNDEADAQAAMKNDPKYILGKTRVKPVKEAAGDAQMKNQMNQQKIQNMKKKVMLKKQELQKQLQLKTQQLKKQARTGVEQDATR